MRTKIVCELKKIISILVCVMMVLVTCPVNMLSSAVFAPDEVQTQAIPNEVEEEDDGQEISLEGGGGALLEAKNIIELQTKINEAQDGDTIKLTDNICAMNDEGYGLTIKDKKITIISDEGIRKISCVGDGNLLEIKGENSDVTFKNVKIDGPGVKKANSLIKVGKGSLNIGKDASICDCWSEGCGGAIYCVENGSVTVSEGKIYNCRSELSGGAIYCEQGRIDITQGGKIADCRCERLGGAIYCKQGRIDITQGGKIEDSTAQTGGGIYCGSGVTVDISGGVISGCQATEEAGAIYCDQKVILAIRNGGKISYCEAVTGGAIVAVELVEIKLEEDGEIFNCHATRYGGAISCYFKSKLYVNPGGKIFGCGANITGGAIYCSSAEVYITGGEISNCSSDENGGAISCFGNQELIKMTGGTISGCHAKCGGAVCGCGDKVVVEIWGGQLIDCWAQEGGNVIFMPGGTWSLIDLNLDKLTIKKAATAAGVDISPSRVGGYEGIYIDIDSTDFIIKNAYENENNENESGVDNEIAVGKTWHASTITTLKSAVTKSCDGDVIVLTQSIAIPNSIVNDEYALTVKNKNITITADRPDLKITCNNKGGFLKIEGENSGVTLKNITVDGNNINRTAKNIYFIEILKGNFNLLENAKIVNCDCDTGNIFCRDGKVNISGGTISNCKSKNYGGAIYLWNAELNVMDGAFINRCHGQNGGFVYCLSGKVNFKGGSVYRCDADENGGAVYFQSGTLEMTGGMIVGCQAKNEGGAIYCFHGILNIRGGVVSDCSALSGGAISCVDFDSRLNMTGGRISQSFAVLGGGVYSLSGIVNLEGGAIVECKAVGNYSSFGRGNVVYSHSGILSLLDARLPGLRISKTSDATGIDSDPLQVGHHEGVYVNKLSRVYITGGYVDDGNKNSNVSFDSKNSDSTAGGSGGSGGGSGKVIPKNINSGALGDIADTLFDVNMIEEDKKDDDVNMIEEDKKDDDVDMIDEGDEIENEKYEDEDDEIENDRGSSEKEKNDGLGALVPWFIGAAVVAIGAVAVVFVLKNKGAN